MQTPSNYYKTDKKSKNPSNNSNSNAINLEDELYELFHENSQLKNFLKEVKLNYLILYKKILLELVLFKKEEIIKLLQEKIKSTKASLYQVNEQQIKLINNEDNMAYIRFEKTKPFKTEILTSPSMTSNETKNNMTMPTCSMSSRTLPSQIADSGISNDTSISTFNSFSNFFFIFSLNFLFQSFFK